MAAEPSAPSRTAGSQTLARGLKALRSIAVARDGLTIQEVADQLGVHRTIAYRILNTLADEGLIHRNDDGRYRGASGLLGLAAAAHSAMRAAALPVLADVARELQSTVSVLIQEGPDAVALAVVEPTGVGYHIAFAQGSRHPLERGAAGLAIRACYPPSDHDPEDLRLARDRGYAVTYAEVEPGMYGLAAPITGGGAPACINLITNRRELVEGAGNTIIAAAARISSRLA
ncbi:helix-turn-helix domain-containing protein [Arthrobacter sp. I2-34]|uniref:Helix-turn-helix domain-containing protein n=1 Tax=Arthrobacter hankyongi TaxID=2904801 RepID=A0ABS9L3C8_9MICC|nr:helix-turn-helix domain-containing protein [Arthrobacter hankyongi]MCG2621111.1 helix-turn-helix domain-containing protein [Arthrobacter hankyongi]